MKNQSNGNTDPIYYQEANKLAEMIRNKEITSVEVVQAHLDRVAEINPRMKNAGAIALMKTNLPEFSAHWESDNLVTGQSLNPWNPDRTPGGSSGGESAVM